MSKNEINIYYKGIKQKLKYYGKFDINSIKSTVKQIFKINEPIEQVYFQDEDGDIVILNDQTPSGISVHVFVEPNSIPENPSTKLKVPESSEELLKFHWFIDKEIGQNGRELNVIKDKYIYRTIGNDILSGVRSSCSFEKGKHFFVLRKSQLHYYTLLAITEDNIYPLPEYKLDLYSCCFSREYSMGIFDGYPEENLTFATNLGIYIDMDNKKCIFYDYDKKTRNKIKYYDINKNEKEGFEAPILCPKLKLVAWFKGGLPYLNECITILNEGCIPIPDWVKTDINSNKYWVKKKKQF